MRSASSASALKVSRRLWVSRGEAVSPFVWRGLLPLLGLLLVAVYALGDFARQGIEARVREDPRFEIAAPRTMNLVCFRLRAEGPESDARNKALMDRLNQSGALYLTHTVLPTTPARPLAGRLVLRMAIGASTTTHAHVESAWNKITDEAGRT